MTSYLCYIPLLLTLLIGSASPANAQRYVISPKSELWIAGTSTLNAFECRAKTLSFDYEVAHQIQGSGFTVPGVSLVVPVRSLDCENRRMNRDLQDALQADDFPDIRLDVLKIDLVPEAQADVEQMNTPSVDVYVTMTLAGVSREILIQMTGWLDEDLNLHGVGALEVKMTDFDVDPPTALFGLVKAHDDITIRFHLTAQASEVREGMGALVATIPIRSAVLEYPVN